MNLYKLGILRLGSKSTLFYINELNTILNKDASRDTYSVKIVDTDFTTINNLLPNPSKELDEIIRNYINELCKVNIKTILIPNITLHETIDRLKIDAHIAHPLHSTISEIKKHKQKEIVLFGSSYTMQSNYIKSIFDNNNIKTLLPSIEDMQHIDDIRKQVYMETITEDLRESFHLTIKKYTKNKSIVIACTELSLLIPKKNINVFDMALIQINEAVTCINNLSKEDVSE